MQAILSLRCALAISFIHFSLCDPLPVSFSQYPQPPPFPTNTNLGVASRMAPVAVTSDVGGSTRIPAFYNGLFGHKPTGATVPNTGTMPKISPGSAVSKYCQIGPTARSAHDLMPLLRVLAGSDGVDLVTRENTDHLNFQNPEDVRLCTVLSAQYHLADAARVWWWLQ